MRRPTSQVKVKPFSQTGFIRVPANPKQRNFDESGLPVARKKVLERVNDADKYGFMHATKGYRRVSRKRLAATRIAGEIKGGATWWPPHKIAQELAAA